MLRFFAVFFRSERICSVFSSLFGGNHPLLTNGLGRLNWVDMLRFFHPEARKNAEMLGLMVNEPNVEPNELKRIQSPTLVIAGDKDMIKDSHTRLIAAHIPKSELQIIPGDHFIANKNPELFNEVVLRFLLR